MDSEEIRKVSNARSHLFKTTACGNFLPANVVLLDESKNFAIQLFLPRYFKTDFVVDLMKELEPQP